MFSVSHMMCRIFFSFVKRLRKHLLLGNQMDWTLESESNESVKFKERLGIIGPGLDELSRGGVPSAT